MNSKNVCLEWYRFYYRFEGEILEGVDATTHIRTQLEKNENIWSQSEKSFRESWTFLKLHKKIINAIFPNMPMVSDHLFGRVSKWDNGDNIPFQFFALSLSVNVLTNQWSRARLPVPTFRSFQCQNVRNVIASLYLESWILHADNLLNNVVFHTVLYGK